MKKVECKLCRKMVPKDEAFRTALQSFCSKDHYIDYKNKPKASSKPKNNWDKIRLEVIALDGGRCRLCGSATSLHVHHIVYRSEKKDDSLSNLITLCSEHHDLVHSNKAKYQPILLEMVSRIRGI